MTGFARIERDKLGHPSLENIRQLIDEIIGRDPPVFSEFEPDLEDVKGAVEEIGDINDLVVIGHGGSVTTFKGLQGSLGRFDEEAPRVHIMDTVDPIYVKGVRNSVDPGSTHVITVSKSGSTLTTLEILYHFRDLPTTVATTPGDNPLRKLASSRGWNAVDLPDNIPGRFSGRTASALLPAAVCGMDLESISRGFGAAYYEARTVKDLVELSGHIYLKERIGKRVLFIPVYSKGLSSFNALVTQLLHETLGKERKGPTVLCFEGPECQHHTNQRILDGAEDVQTLFITSGRDPTDEIRWEEKEIPIRGRTLGEMSGYDLSKAMEGEYTGVMRDMEEREMPFARIHLRSEGPEEIGFYVGMWHYLAYYFALLRNVNPFNQPAVEGAKQKAMDFRLES
jgi:glucose-6-phosphate isomerase